MIYPEGQAGASANLQILDGLTIGDLEAAEDMILEWHESGDYRAVDVVIKVYEHLTAAALGALSGLSLDSEAQCSDR
jgi:hypothetical protein